MFALEEPSSLAPEADADRFVLTFSEGMGEKGDTTSCVIIKPQGCHSLGSAVKGGDDGPGSKTLPQRSVARVLSRWRFRGYQLTKRCPWVYVEVVACGEGCPSLNETGLRHAKREKDRFRREVTSRLRAVGACGGKILLEKDERGLQSGRDLYYSRQFQYPRRLDQLFCMHGALFKGVSSTSMILASKHFYDQRVNFTPKYKTHLL